MVAAGLGGDLSVKGAGHGDAHLNSIAGSVQVHLSNNKHDFSARQVQGDLIADGNCNDLTFSDIKGRVSMNGQIFGEVHVENVAGPVSVHTQITDVPALLVPCRATSPSIPTICA